MKKSKYLSLLVLPLFLFSCGQNSSISTSDSSSIEEGSSSVEISSESSHSSQENSSEESSQLTQLEVEEKIGDITKLKTLFEEYKKKSVTSFITETTDYSGTTTKIHTFKETEYKCETTKSSKTTISYEGLVDYVYYTYSNEYSASATREKVYPDLEGDEVKDSSKKYYTDTLEKIKKNNVSTQIDSTSNWGGILKGSKEESYGITGTVIDSYNVLLSGDKILLQVEGFENTFSGYTTKKYSISIAYSLVAEFDTSFILKSGTLETNNYQADTLDESTHRPTEGAKPSLTKSFSINEITFGALESSLTPMIDFSSAFTTSITEDAYISTSYLDQSTWEYTFSNKNEVFLGSTIDDTCLVLSEDNNTYYLPKTAIDNGGNATIVSSSDESVIHYDDSVNGFVVVESEDAVDKTVTLTIGNDFIDSLGIIEVKVVASPSSSGGGSNEVPVLDDSASPYIHKGEDIATYDSINSKLTITGTGDVVICIPVYSTMDLYNSDLMGNVQLYLETTKVSGKILTPDEAKNYEGICVQFNATANCSTFVGLFNQSNGNPMIAFELVVQLA